MSKFRLYPTAAQEQRMLLYCSHARYIWNIAVEQLNHSTRERRMPGPAEQSRQLTEARHEYGWLREVPTVVGQQALRDFRQACTNWWGGSHRRPKFRRRGVSDGFRIVSGHGIRVDRLNRKWSRAWVPSLGWVKFRRTREVGDARSYRVTYDASGRWHIAFAVRPEPIEPAGDGLVIGVDRGVTVTLAYSDGTMLHAPKPKSVKKAAQALSRCRRGSNRRRKAKARLAKVHATNKDRRKDFVEKTTTDLARRADMIRIEALPIRNMVRSAKGTVGQPGRNVKAKAGLNRSIMERGWDLFASRLDNKAPGRVERIDPKYSSQRCSQCGCVDAKSRESQALFTCTACGFSGNADINAAVNIAAGHQLAGADSGRRAVRGDQQSGSVKREPQRTRLPAV